MKRLDEILNQKSSAKLTEERRFLAMQQEERDIIDKEKTRRLRQLQGEANAKVATAFVKFGASIIVAVVSFNVGVLNNDGGLFRGLFLQLLALTSGFASVVFLVQLVYFLSKRS